MTLEGVHVSEVPNLEQFSSTCSISPEEEHVSNDNGNGGYKWPKFMVIGHRGCGMNLFQSPDPRMKSIKENSILSFNDAATNFPIDFVEFDVQVIKDDCPIIYHDNYILTQDKGDIIEKRVTDLTQAEFLSYGPQKTGNAEKPLFRKTKDGRIYEWKVEKDDPLCTLQEVFQKVHPSLGFNIELKFDDSITYDKEKLTHVIQVILRVVNEHSKNRTVIFSTFLPDAAQLIRKLQSTYPVFFLTNGGSEIYADIRRNSLDEAIKVCQEGGLQGIVSEVKAIFRNPEAVARIKESKLSLLTYGQLNNVPQVVHKQHIMDVDGVIVDLVQDITEAVSDFSHQAKDGEEEKQEEKSTQPQFSHHEFSFLLQPEFLFLHNLMPELVIDSNRCPIY